MGARADNVSDPALAADLLLARRGQAFLSRKIAELGAEEFAEPSLVPGWSRAHVVANVGYHARALALGVERARRAPEQTDTAADELFPDIDFGATLPVAALRNLVAHAAVHLSVEWRDLPAQAWANSVVLSDGAPVPASATAWIRAREVWLSAIHLRNGARLTDVPDSVRRRATEYFSPIDLGGSTCS